MTLSTLEAHRPLACVEWYWAKKKINGRRDRWDKRQRPAGEISEKSHFTSWANFSFEEKCGQWQQTFFLRAFQTLNLSVIKNCEVPLLHLVHASKHALKNIGLCCTKSSCKWVTLCSKPVVGECLWLDLWYVEIRFLSRFTLLFQVISALCLDCSTDAKDYRTKLA